MNDHELDRLLRLKSEVTPPSFPRSAEAFKQNFFAAAPRETPTEWWKYMSRAAALLIVAGLLFLAMQRNPATLPEQDKLAEAQRLFGDAAAAVFCGDELVTGDRLGNGGREKRFELKLRSADGGAPLVLTFAGREGESIVLDSPFLSGVILLSRSDAATLVVELELEYRGQTIRGILPLPQRQETNGTYHAAVHSS